MSKLPKPRSHVLEGTLTHPIFSPRGTIEGLLLSVDDEPMQVVLDEDEFDPAFLAGLEAGNSVAVEVRPAAVSDKGEPVHALFELVRFVTIEGRDVEKTQVPDRFEGAVTRLNFARHGEPNGVVLDSGHFIHLKPNGMKSARLGVGDRVTASGEARPLAGRRGYVVEPRELNGRAVKG